MAFLPGRRAVPPASGALMPVVVAATATGSHGRLLA
jgi:hypothetical protein